MLGICELEPSPVLAAPAACDMADGKGADVLPGGRQSEQEKSCDAKEEVQCWNEG